MTAYVREGDHDDWIKAYKKNECLVSVHPRKYRSVHYLIKTALSKSTSIVEIQARTIFEEAWSEVDHHINYPIPASPIVRFCLQIFNRLAGSADEMGSFLHKLNTELKYRDIDLEGIRNERDEAISNVENLVEKLEITTANKDELQSEIRKLKSKIQGQTPISFGLPEIKPDNQMFFDTEGRFTQQCPVRKLQTVLKEC